MNDQEAYEFYADPANREPAGPARKRRSPRKTKMVAVRFDPAVIETVARLADSFGVTVGHWIRAAVARESERQRRRWLDEHRSELQVMPGSGRLLSRAIPPSGRTFACPHFSVSNVISAACETCGQLGEAS